jgi:magnesium chelatase family protein
MITEQKTADVSDIIGQEHAKRAIEVAAVGSANILFVGASGNGKSMLCEAYAGLLGSEEVIRVSVADTIKSLAGKIENCYGQDALFIVDELPELKRDVLLYIKEISQAGNIPVAATMLPCPCGYLSDPRHQCTCIPGQIAKYRAPLSGSLRELFDIHIEVPAIPVRELCSQINGTKYKSETSEQVLGRVIPAMERYKLNRDNLKPHKDAVDLLSVACHKLGFSAKAVSGILKIARAIADLEGEDVIKSHHISEAIQYRARQ